MEKTVVVTQTNWKISCLQITNNSQLKRLMSIDKRCFNLHNEGYFCRLHFFNDFVSLETVDLVFNGPLVSDNHKNCWLVSLNVSKRFCS